MRFLGLTAAAWVVVLTAIATYCGLIASYLLVRPALRGLTLQTNIDLLESEQSTNPRIEKFRQLAVNNLKGRRPKLAKHDRSLYGCGVALLILSFLIFSGAVVLQLRTDPAFHHPAKPPSSSP